MFSPWGMGGVLLCMSLLVVPRWVGKLRPHLLKQWAAVRTHMLLIRTPPQWWTLFICKLTCHGQSPSSAFVPPRILSSDKVIRSGRAPHPIEKRALMGWEDHDSFTFGDAARVSTPFRTFLSFMYSSPEHASLSKSMISMLFFRVLMSLLLTIDCILENISELNMALNSGAPSEFSGVSHEWKLRWSVLDVTASAASSLGNFQLLSSFAIQKCGLWTCSMGIPWKFVRNVATVWK